MTMTMRMMMMMMMMPTMMSMSMMSMMSMFMLTSMSKLMSTVWILIRCWCRRWCRCWSWSWCRCWCCLPQTQCYACIIVLHVCWRRTYHSCGNHWAPDHAFDWCLATGNPLHSCNCTNCTWGTFASMVGGTISRLWEQLTWTITSFMSPVQEMVSGASAKIRLKFLMNCFWGESSV